MSKIVTSKSKLSRRMGHSVWGRAKDAVHARKTPPGQHGEAATRKKYSDFGLQLRAKQQLKGYYNMGERQFRKIYKEAIRLKGDSSENLVGLLERRLDMVVYRSNFAPSIFSARQLVSHAHITVNGKKVNIGSYQVKDNDVVEVKQKSKQLAIVLETVQKAERDVPGYILVDNDKLSAKYARQPLYADIPYPVQMEPHLIIEFYSR